MNTVTLVTRNVSQRQLGPPTDSFYNDLGEFADSEEQARLDALEQESTKKKRRLRKVLRPGAGDAQKSQHRSRL